MSKFVHEGQEKKAYVKSMFNDISYRYDLFNALSSFGIDRYWRYRLIKKFNLNTSDKLLDIATGTGDVIFGMHKKFSNELIGLDIAEKMIDFANKKKEKKGLHLENITFIQGDAEDLGFSDNSFNALTISFGFRNLGNYDKGLSEFFRVLKPKSKIFGELSILQISYKVFKPKLVLFFKICKPCFTIALFKPTRGTTSQTVPNDTKSKKFKIFGSSMLLFLNQFSSLNFLFKATKKTKETPAAHK